MQALVLVLAGFGGLVLLIALSRWLAGRPWACLGHLALAVALLSAALWLWPVATHLATYETRRADAPIAEIACERTSSRSYRVTLTRLPGGRMQVFEVTGDEWQLRTRALSWQGRAVDLGLRPGYRLDRLGIRSAGAPADGRPLPASYALTEGAGADVWSAARSASAWSKFAVATTVVGPWLPLADGARFEVRLQPQALAVRPVNEAAAKSLAAAPAPAVSVPPG